MREGCNEGREGGKFLRRGEGEGWARGWQRLEVVLAVFGRREGLFVHMWVVVGGDGPGEVDGGVGDEEKVAGEEEQGAERDEGGAVL